MKLTVLFRSCFLLLIVLSLSACDKVVVDTDTPSNNEARRNGEKRFTTRGGELSHDVTPEDIEAYIKYKDLASKDSYFEVKSIIPFPNEDNPVLYAINFKNHWEMISSSKRTSPIIACGEGEFNPATDNENFLAWLGVLAEEISVLKATNFQPKDSEEYEKFWQLITADNDFIKSLYQPTRSGPDTLDHPVQGHYELYDVESYTYVSDSINHLVTTKWGQDTPYNQYCPRDFSSQAYYYGYPLCLTGCVPIAGAQVVYFFHYAGDATPAIYDSAYCNTREYPNTDWTQMYQWHKTTSNWAKFNTADSSRMAAVMTANIGKTIEAEYHFNQTGASIEALSDCLYDEYDLVKKEYEKKGENTYMLSGSLPTYEVEKIFNIENTSIKGIMLSSIS